MSGHFGGEGWLHYRYGVGKLYGHAVQPGFALGVNAAAFEVPQVSAVLGQYEQALLVRLNKTFRSVPQIRRYDGIIDRIHKQHWN